MKIKEIQNLIKFVAKSGAQEVKLEMEDVKITIKTGSAPSQIESGGLVQQIQAVPTPIVSQIPVQTTPITQQEPPKNEEKTEENDKFITIKSPIIGTFYRKPSPDKPSFNPLFTDSIALSELFKASRCLEFVIIMLL